MEVNHGWDEVVCVLMMKGYARPQTMRLFIQKAVLSVELLIRELAIGAVTCVTFKRQENLDGKISAVAGYVDGCLKEKCV